MKDGGRGKKRDWLVETGIKTKGSKQTGEFCNWTGKSQTESGENVKTEEADVRMVSGNSAVGEKEIKWGSRNILILEQSCRPSWFMLIRNILQKKYAFINQIKTVLGLCLPAAESGQPLKLGSVVSRHLCIFINIQHFYVVQLKRRALPRDVPWKAARKWWFKKAEERTAVRSKLAYLAYLL